MADGYGIHWYNTVNETAGWMIELYKAKYRSNSFNTVNQSMIATTTQFIEMPVIDFRTLYFLLQGDDSSMICSN